MAPPPLPRRGRCCPGRGGERSGGRTRSPAAAERRAPVPGWGAGRGGPRARSAPLHSTLLCSALLRSARPWRAAAARGFQAARAQGTSPAPAGDYRSQHAPRGRGWAGRPLGRECQPREAVRPGPACGVTVGCGEEGGRRGGGVRLPGQTDSEVLVVSESLSGWVPGVFRNLLFHLKPSLKDTSLRTPGVSCPQEICLHMLLKRTNAV